MKPENTEHVRKQILEFVVSRKNAVNVAEHRASTGPDKSGRSLGLDPNSYLAEPNAASFCDAASNRLRSFCMSVALSPIL